MGVEDLLILSPPKGSFVCKFPLLFKPPTNLEWHACFFGISLPSVSGGRFQIIPGKLPRILQINTKAHPIHVITCRSSLSGVAFFTDYYSKATAGWCCFKILWDKILLWWRQGLVISLDMGCPCPPVTSLSFPIYLMVIGIMDHIIVHVHFLLLSELICLILSGPHVALALPGIGAVLYLIKVCYSFSTHHRQR